MANRYRWCLTDMRTLRDNTQKTHDILVEVSNFVNQLVADIEADTMWNAAHKVAFLAWLDLLKQYHAKMADVVIGPSAVQSLNSFLDAAASFTENSAVFKTLGDVG